MNCEEMTLDKIDITDAWEEIRQRIIEEELSSPGWKAVEDELIIGIIDDIGNK